MVPTVVVNPLLAKGLGPFRPYLPAVRVHLYSVGTLVLARLIRLSAMGSFTRPPKVVQCLRPLALFAQVNSMSMFRSMILLRRQAFLCGTS